MPRLLLLACLLVAVRAVPASAAAPNRAGLAVLFADGTLLTRCVDFEGDTITGSEMLARSGLQTVIDPTHGGGITVCKIEGTGCDYPVDPCFCRCMGGGACTYWNYFYRGPGEEEWVYSTLGALLHHSVPGSVEAWVWGDGHTPPGPSLTFEAICLPSPTPRPPATPQGAQATPLPPASPSPLPAPALTPAGAAASSSTALSTVEPAATLAPALPAQGGATASPTAPSSSPGARGGLRSYWPFGLMLLALAALAAYLRAGRRA